VPFLYFLSGVAGLLYEIVWLRLLSLELGHTAGAIATVLAAFMGGLAVGAALGGRWLEARRVTRVGALHLYAAFEILIAACALALPFALEASGPMLGGAYGDAGGASFGVLRVALCLVLVSVPAAAMGATYPVAIRAAAGRSSKRVEGTLYAVNTAGAALGAALTGFALLPAAGMWRATLTGVALNVFVAACAIWITRSATSSQETTAPPPRTRGPADTRESSPGHLRPAAAALFVTGFIALMSEVAWTRVFALAIGPTTYAFAVMLVAFIGGLAAGAAAGNRLAGRVSNPVRAVAWCLVAIAAGTVFGVSWIERVPLMVGAWVAAPDARFGSVLATEAVLCAALLLPVTVALGAAFPLALAVGLPRMRLEPRTRAPKAVAQSRAIAVESDAAGPAGWLFAANTAGAIAGSLAAGFLIIPWIGIRGALVSAAGIALVAASVISWSAATGLRGRVAAGVLLACLIGLWILPPWNPSLLTGGAYKYAPYLRRLELREALEAGTLLYFREGAAGTVSVRRTAGRLALAIDGKVDASNGGDMLTQKLLAHLPLLSHPAPRMVAIVGLGSGVTAGAALRHPIERLDVVEISREVVDASRLFDSDSGRPLADTRTRLIVGDARTHLALTSSRYDVIISEPSNPWMAGVAALFTREFFAQARDRLAEGGMMCQWAHTYDIREEDLRSIVATFSSVFPSTSLWLVGDADLLLLGSTATTDNPGAEVAKGFARAGVKEDLATVGATGPFGVLSLFAGSGRALAEFSAGAEIQRDDRLQLEFSAPRSIIGATTGDNARALRERLQATTPPPLIAAARTSATASDWTDRGNMLLEAGSTAAMDDFTRGIELADPRALDGLRRAAVSAGRIEEALALLDRLARTHQLDGAFDVTISQLLAGAGDLRGAAEAAERSLLKNRQDVGALVQLASVQADASDADGLARTLVPLRALASETVDRVYYDGVLAYMRGDLQSAVVLAQQALDKQPTHARALTLSGAARASLGDRDSARRAFEAAVAATPGDPAPYINLGELELSGGNATRAAAWFAEALTVDPDSSAAREGLAKALESQGERARAVRLRSGRSP
jgi:spermidine synthase